MSEQSIAKTVLTDQINISPTFCKNFIKSNAHTKQQKESLLKELKSATIDLERLVSRLDADLDKQYRFRR